MCIRDRGKFVKSWGKEFQGGAHGLHIHTEGSQEYLYLCDTKRGIMVKTTLDGEEVFTLGYPKESEFYKLDKDGKPATKYSPTNLAIAPNGDIYVGDGYGSSSVSYTHLDVYKRQGFVCWTDGDDRAGDSGAIIEHGGSAAWTLPWRSLLATGAAAGVAAPAGAGSGKTGRCGSIPDGTAGFSVTDGYPREGCDHTGSRVLSLIHI